MKKILYIFCLITFLGCNSEDAGDCIQTAGEIIQKEYEVATFTKIHINKKIELIIKEGPTQKVIVETGKNLMPDIEVEVIDGKIFLTNHNTCNFFRDYGITKVYITSPDISEIRNASELNVTSDGVLTYPKLYLESTGVKNEFLSIGDWYLNIDNESLTILSNGIPNFYINGTSNNLTLYFSDGDSRFEGQNFKVQNINFSHVSSNDILVYPIESLKGTIHSVGNVTAYNKPPIVEVEVLSEGKLTFN
ncbi:DUF2807 domain-containing protein [Lutibacter sp. A80]|uniref:head GIN domain-containing protein n=1 Tax=Lutibacter sp. A80 TaxID=2918453 RepID=UPI001F06BE2A|nr:head GIN domain-containing protein [Lutibacter sp. A80]UMB60140.1 DUF2807 domain-containing protein [Lutibacter sp. A80]